MESDGGARRRRGPPCLLRDETCERRARLGVLRLNFLCNASLCNARLRSGTHRLVGHPCVLSLVGEMKLEEIKCFRRAGVSVERCRLSNMEDYTTHYLPAAATSDGLLMRALRTENASPLYLWWSGAA